MKESNRELLSVSKPDNRRETVLICVPRETVNWYERLGRDCVRKRAKVIRRSMAARMNMSCLGAAIVEPSLQGLPVRSGQIAGPLRIGPSVIGSRPNAGALIVARKRWTHHDCPLGPVILQTPGRNPIGDHLLNEGIVPSPPVHPGKAAGHNNLDPRPLRLRQSAELGQRAKHLGSRFAARLGRE